MARLMFGGGVSDWTFTSDASGTPTVVGGIVITFYDQRTGGNQYTDLTGLAGESLSTVTSSTGGDGNALGQIPAFFGPDGVYEMWASAAGGPRVLMAASSLGSYLGPVRTQLEAHIAAVNPHNTTLGSLKDVANLDAATTGQLLAKAADGSWKPTTVGGISGTVQLDGDQAITGKKTWENQNANTVRQIVNSAESQTVDVMQFWSSAAAGQGGAKTKTTAMNAKGEARFAPAKSDSVAVQVTGQSGQTANVFEQTTSAGTVQSRMEANGSWRAPNLARSLMFAKSGTLVAGAGTFSFFNDSGVPLTIRSVRATVNTAPTGAAVIVDVNMGGTTIFGTQANRPTIAAAAKTSGKATGFSVSTIPDGSSITVDIDQIGSTVAGADLVVQVDVY